MGKIFFYFFPQISFFICISILKKVQSDLLIKKEKNIDSQIAPPLKKAFFIK